MLLYPIIMMEKLIIQIQINVDALYIHYTLTINLYRHL